MALKRFAMDVAALSAARGLQTLAAFVAVPLIARLLGPHEYGLVALAMSFIVCTIFLADAGMGQSLVRTPASDHATWASASWTILGFGVALALVLALAAYGAGALFHEPRLTNLLLALAIVPTIVAMAAPPTSLMQQAQRFRELAAFESVAALAGLGVAIVLALRGAGAWAVAVQQLVFWGVKAGLLFAATRFRPKLLWRRDCLGDHVRFARDNTGSTLLYFFARQIDPLVVGKVLGTGPLGFYGFATRLMWLPHQLISSPVQNTLYVRMVQIREDKAALRELFLILTSSVALLVFPGVAVFAAAAAAYFSFFLSSVWLPAAPVFMWLAPVAALQTVTVPATALLLATGRTGARLRQMAELAVLWVVVLLAAAPFGIMAVAAAFTVVNLLYLPRSLQLTLPVIDCSIAQYLRVLFRPAAAAGAILALHVLLRSELNPAPPAEILLSLVELFFVYAALAWTSRTHLRSQLNALRSIIARSNAPSPAVLADAAASRSA